MNINPSNTTPPHYSTTSLDLGAYLLAIGVEFFGYERRPDGNLLFQFHGVAGALVDAYFAGDEVPAIRFWSEIKRLKALVHSSKMEHVLDG